MLSLANFRRACGGSEDCFNNTIPVLENLGIPEAQHAIASRAQEMAPRLVMRDLPGFGVLRSVEFDDELCAVADEFDVVAAYRRLPAKMKTFRFKEPQQYQRKRSASVEFARGCLARWSAMQNRKSKLPPLAGRSKNAFACTLPVLIGCERFSGEGCGVGTWPRPKFASLRSQISTSPQGGR
jgi:hypothetical protein